MPQSGKKPEPVRPSLAVDCPLYESVLLFTEHCADWWPTETSSISGAPGATSVVEPWEGGRVFERTPSGEELDWGVITAWEPPHKLELSLNQADQTVD